MKCSFRNAVFRKNPPKTQILNNMQYNKKGNIFALPVYSWWISLNFVSDEMTRKKEILRIHWREHGVHRAEPLVCLHLMRFEVPAFLTKPGLHVYRKLSLIWKQVFGGGSARFTGRISGHGQLMSSRRKQKQNKNHGCKESPRDGKKNKIKWLTWGVCLAFSLRWHWGKKTLGRSTKLYAKL